MNRKIHLLLILGCVVIAALDAPRASRLFSEGLSGPYAERPVEPTVAPTPAVEDPELDRQRLEAAQAEEQRRRLLLQTQVVPHETR